ncbi:MAG TPA: acetylglutamate kinase [Terriglobia bacterium]|nr:acetylglutamate kinase [Terriglobia bacterium]
MTKVIKVGGVLLEDPQKAVHAIRGVQTDRAAVVHGGGLQITRMLERMDVKSVFIEGLRVTDENTLAAVAAALLGEVHAALVRELRRQGLPAVGMFGAVQASKKEGPWGLVGTNVHANAAALTALLNGGHMPVVPTLALGDDSLLNVNGDETAAAVAVALQCRELVFLTDVAGVKNADGTVIEKLSRPDELLTASFVTGGMIPKLRAVKAAMDGGIEVVRVGRTIFGEAS